MPRNNLLKTLREAYPAFRFVPGKEFRWSARSATIYYNSTEENAASLLHELAHALLGHTQYETDIDRLQMESSAWHYAQHTLAPKFGITITDDEKEDALDTYRDWLHRRSLCDSCNVPGIQVKTDTYQCLNCRCQWEVAAHNRRRNSARSNATAAA
jgi:hypothetical protein